MGHMACFLTLFLVNLQMVATTIYTRGTAALATVMMHMGLNATEEDLTNWAVHYIASRY